MYEEEAGPGRGWYGVAVWVSLVGVSFGAWLLFSTVREFLGSEEAIRVVAPCREEVELSKAGKWTVFYEHQTVLGGRAYSTGESLPGLECSLVPKGGGAEIELRGSPGASYSYGARHGVSVFAFLIEAPGTYEFSAQYPGNREGTEVVLAFAHDFLGRLLRSILRIFAGVGITIASVAAGIGIAVATHLKRQRARKPPESPPAGPRPAQ